VLGVGGTERVSGVGVWVDGVVMGGWFWEG